MNGDNDSYPCLAAITFRSDLSVSPSQTFTSSVSFSRRFIRPPDRQVQAKFAANHVDAELGVKRCRLSAFLLRCMSLVEFLVCRLDKNIQPVRCILAFELKQMHFRNNQLQIKHHSSYRNSTRVDIKFQHMYLQHILQMFKVGLWHSENKYENIVHI